jgi:hypothetical protein
MSKVVNRAVYGPLLALLLCAPLAAAAPQAGGNGVKFGEGRVHPFFDYEVRYDSAAALLVPSGGAPYFRPELISHFRPGLKLELPGAPMAFSMDGNLDFLWYMGVLTPGTQATSRLQGALNLGAHLNKGGWLQVVVGDRFIRSDRSGNPAVGVGVLSLFNELKAEVPIQPGGGALEVKPGAAWTVEFFDSISPYAVGGACPGGDPSCNPAQVSQLNYTNLRFDLDGRYKFLPKTALVLDTDFDIRSNVNAASNALLLAASAGVAGLVSPKVAILAKLGWGQDFAASAAQTVIAHAEVSYLASELLTVKGGYLRKLSPVAGAGTFRDDRGYLEGRALMGGRLTLRASASYDVLSFYLTPRADTVLTVSLLPEYQFRPWLVGGLGYVLGWRTSTLPLASLNFPRNEAYAKLTLTY